MKVPFVLLPTPVCCPAQDGKNAASPGPEEAMDGIAERRTVRVSQENGYLIIGPRELYGSTPRFVTFCIMTFCNAISRCVTFCNAIFRNVISRCVIFCNAIFRNAISRCVTFCNAIFRYATS